MSAISNVKTAPSMPPKKVSRPLYLSKRPSPLGDKSSSIPESLITKFLRTGEIPVTPKVDDSLANVSLERTEENNPMPGIGIKAFFAAIEKHSSLGN